MNPTQAPTQTAPTAPKRADARRNYEPILTVARRAFARGRSSTSLEEIARQAGVGIGTLHRHFPSRQVLLETLYVEEVHDVRRSASQSEHDPWKALSVWCEGLIGYLTTKRALAQELLNYLDEDAALFQECRRTVFPRRRTAAETRSGRRRRTAGCRVLRRAPHAGRYLADAREPSRSGDTCGAHRARRPSLPPAGVRTALLRAVLTAPPPSPRIGIRVP